MSRERLNLASRFLTEQKLFDPTFKVDLQKAAAWAASRHSEHTFVDTHEHVLVTRVRPREMVEVENALREQLHHEWSLVTICVHLFLDRAGLPP